VASIGLRPTVDDQGRWLLEVHLFDFSREIYGALVRVEFVQKLREEQKYETLDALAAAIRRDAERARAILSGAPA
jgi:riboflavin kinase/FMN adenylyltransferase